MFVECSLIGRIRNAVFEEGKAVLQNVLKGYITHNTDYTV